jgi:uncharacterized membrane protein YhhN
MKFPRFTVRRMMALVALAAMVLGLVAWMVRRAAEYRAKAVFYEGMIVTMIWKDSSPPPELARQLWAGEMASKYRYAASYPWWPVAPDEPEPK